jgi:hypothetical protein
MPNARTPWAKVDRPQARLEQQQGWIGQVGSSTGFVCQNSKLVSDILQIDVQLRNSFLCPPKPQKNGLIRPRVTS